MNECTQPCHDLHDMHKKHCDTPKEKKPPTEKQEAFFEKLREEGRAQAAAQCYIECLKAHGEASPCATAIQAKFNLKITY